LQQALNLNSALERSILNIGFIEASLSDGLVISEALSRLINKLHYALDEAITVNQSFIEDIYTILNLFEDSGGAMGIGGSVSYGLGNWYQQILHALELRDVLTREAGNWYQSSSVVLAIEDFLYNSVFSIEAISRHSFYKNAIPSFKKQRTTTSFQARG